MASTEPRIRVAVLGGAGYVGGELLRLLSLHPLVDDVRGFSTSQAGRPWSAAHPSLAHRTEAAFEQPDLEGAAAWADVLFLAWPHGRSQQVIDALLACEPKLLIDLAADFRLEDPELYCAAYGPHRCPDRMGDFRYGLADVAGTGLAGERLIAAPGCFATAALLAAYPVVTEASLDAAPVCFAVTGSSGAGVEPRRTTHHPVRAHNLFAYKLTGHRHEAELTDQCRRWGAADGCRLITHSGPFVRGIHATLHARLREPVRSARELLQRAYEGRPFVRVLDEPPELASVVGTNFVHLHAAQRRGGRELIVTSVIDNLTKGAAGQAVQTMNLALGLDETAGLDFPGLYPC
ncbi:MAG: N-acetyl-gamma-glutamyl-phosphate reductase [Acidobacteriota bacterium]|nr:MAG: N-acetyl-gamma-glutamyl-phosphate reductase [Acidobacteriota bacterium]